ncbi:hypothetical protein M436DRAFT_63007 [Aureobasidium namibiae CBS 147.97]|uniref:YDG domain-containing protein n=1 Tax=Aureobasidium namibiae CBS 147.97 TaxID=1043004 RepID=A0A074WSX1_9PEZI|nr:uncharacterized protein M436DRAFT_63007 [Aureobasidium namibiae CBS 147.97]KEQ74639.1 hypothetical protein M436DRAFT_63007 [Aureobasidium namibiae CBS 147.97]
MAKQEEAKAFFLSQRSQKSQESTTRPATPPPATAGASPSIPAAAAPTPQTITTARAPVAPFSFVPQRRTELPAEDAMEGGERLQIDMARPEPPEWYNKIKLDQVRKAPRVPIGIEQHLNKITNGIGKCNDAVAKNLHPDPAEFTKINNGIHRLLHNVRGLPAIFDSSTVDYPWYIKEEAAELYLKWWQKDTNPDLFRGIKLGRTKNAKLGRDSAVDSLDPKFKRRKGNVYGNNYLRIGQWWPTQLCAVRDGAHSATIAGICGKTGEGAFSCVLSGGSYPNIDSGDEIWYYGTESDDPSRPTDATQHMIESSRTQIPVRVLRTSKMTTKGPNEYRPEAGMRYDGLYKVIDYEVEREEKQVHLFHLVREPGQGPIRYKGPEVRPTPEELEALGKSKFERQYLA